MFNQDITIINKLYDKATKKTSYVVNETKGFYSSNDAIIISGIQVNKSDNMICRILFEDATDYTPPKKWNGNGWTLKNDDYIVKGKLDISNSTGIDSINEIKDNYECFKITNVSVKDYGSEDMQHFEISGE